jgi:Ca2+-transporting ATPase
MELAIFEKGKEFKKTLENFKLKWDYPFESEGKHMSHVWQNSQNDLAYISMKGSAEGVMAHCSIDQNKAQKINERITFWASKGKRILALAAKKINSTGDRVTDENNLEFMGLLIFSDPIRNSAKSAIAKCQTAGIEIKMITGDHPLTAHSIADELEILHLETSLFNGNQLSEMTKEQRQNAFLTGTIFSRVLPEQKHEMVEVLKANGKIIAMTGDGINDAPALKIADIGISMGESATDVARSSAQMILMKNDFNGIVEAIFEGRKVFANLKRSFSYLISFHFPIIFFALIPPLFNMGNIMLPIHIVLMELIVHPISAFSFENLPSQSKRSDKTLMTKKRFFESLLSGILLSIGALIFYTSTLKSVGIIHARSVTIATLLLGNVFFVLIETWDVITKRFIYTTLALITLIYSILFIPSLSQILYLEKIGLADLGISLGIGLLSSLPSFIMIYIIKL